MIRLTLGLLFTILSLISHAQTGEFNREEWAKLKKEVTFEKYERTSTSKSSAKKERNTEGDTHSSEPREQSEPMTISLGPFAQLIMIIAFIILIVVLLYTLVGKELFTPKPKNITENLDAETIDLEDDIEKSDLEKWLQEAMASRNYRLVLRLYFLMSIQALSELGLITWKKEKTNWDYLAELEEHPLGSPFRQISLAFDLVWYGEKEISEETIQDRIEEFRGFYEKINDLRR